MQPIDNLSCAVILAGGLGTRLGPLTEKIPKPLVRIKGRPYLEHQIRLLQRNHINNILLLTGYLGEQIEQYFGDGADFGLTIQYSREAKPIGTGGALFHARQLLPDFFFLIYGDSYLDIDYQSVWRLFHTFKNADALMVVTASNQADTVGNVCLDAGNTHVLSYDKNHGGEYKYVDAGVLVFSRRIIDRLPGKEPTSLEEFAYPRLAQEGRLMAYLSSGRYYDIGTPERLSLFERQIN